MKENLNNFIYRSTKVALEIQEVIKARIVLSLAPHRKANTTVLVPGTKGYTQHY